MTKKLTNNLGLKILSVVISILLWLIAININDPVGQQTYNISVQLNNLNTLTDNGKYVEVLENTDNVRVSVRAARSVLAELSDKNIYAIADVNKMTEGNYIPIEVGCTKANVNNDNVFSDKEYVKVDVENIKRRQVPISVVVQGEPDEGYMLGGTSTDQNAVMVSGPESIVNTVNSVSVEIDVAKATSDVNISLPIHLFDANGKEIVDSRIEKSISDVSTTASVWLIKQLQVEYLYEGEPADGYVVDGQLKSTVNYVTVAGKASQLKNIQKVEVKEAMDITGATRNVESFVELRKALPDGLTLIEPEADTKAKLSLRIIKVIIDEEDQNKEEE